MIFCVSFNKLKKTRKTGVTLPFILIMKYRKRYIERRLVELFNHFPVVAVLGARQTGKSTLVKHALGDQLKTIVFDPVQDIGNARQDPDLFLHNNPGSLFLDEVQYAPELLAAIKRTVDRTGAAGQYVLSGSQNLSVVKHISESLAGRVAILNLLPMGMAEQEDRTNDFDFLASWLHNEIIRTNQKPALPWFQHIWRGGFPALLDKPDHLAPTFYESYIRTYIERDIRTVSGISNLQLFGRFFSLLAATTASEVNPTQLGRELGIDRKTAQSWLSIADATFQWTEIPAFTRNAIKRVSGKRKGYITDTGIVCYYQRIPSYDMLPGHPMQGRLVETWSVFEIIKRMQSWPVKPALYHYRSYGGVEVDLVLEYGGRLFPIEIKSKSHPVKADTRGIRAFKESFPGEQIEKGLIISAVEEPTWLSDDVLAVPWWFL